MKLQFIIALFLSILLIGCAGSYQSSVAPGYEPPASNQIAVTYLDHPDINISSSATKVLEANLNTCKLTECLSAERTEEIFQKNNISLPKRMTKEYVKKLKETLNVKFLLTGGVTIWKKGSVGFPVASSTEFGASLTMYDLETGEVVWSVSGEETGGSGIFAESPESRAKQVFLAMLKKWDGFCRR